MRIFVIAICVAVSLAGCKKKVAPVANAPASTAPANATVVAAPGGVVVNAGVGGGGGAVQAVRGAVRRTVTMNDLQQIRIFIDNASLASGRMPSTQMTYAALKQEAPNIATLIDEGVLTLNNATTREQVWAYETDALKQGGQVLTGSGVERMDADTLAQRLRQ